MNIVDEVKKLQENRLLRTNEEIEKFEEAIDNILSFQNHEHIKHLCTGFDDNTKDDEVMFSLVHAIESYDNIVESRLSLKEFLYATPNVFSYAKGWVIIMNKRILNDDNSLENYIDVAKDCDNSLKMILIELMNEIKKDNPERFSQVVDKFLLGIK